MPEAAMAVSLADYAKRREISGSDIPDLRRAVFADGVATEAEAAVLFHVNRTVPVKDPAWNPFFVDALTDFVVWKAKPARYVSEGNARFVIDNIVADGRVHSQTELELLLNVVHWAVSCPESLGVFALEAVRDSVLDPDSSAYGQGRRAGVIDAADVAIVRKVIYGQGSLGGYTVTRREAEILLEINERTDHDANDPSWRDLFVKGIGSHLLFPRGAPVVPSTEEARRRERWLAERRSIGALLVAIGRSAARLEVRTGWEAADLFGSRRAAEDEAREKEAFAEMVARERIDSGEAAWLSLRLGGRARLDDNERALLAFIRTNARDIDPALEALMARAGL